MEPLINIETFVQSYLATASFVECEWNENTNFDKSGKEIAKDDCEQFISLVLKEFGEDIGTKLLNTEGTDLHNRASHDFYLTRNGHGAGFWDSPEKYINQEYADKLTTIAQSMGERSAYHKSNRKRNRLTF